MRALALVAALLATAPACRVACKSAADCDRGESCGREGRCVAAPGATPLASLFPGPAFDALFLFPPHGSQSASPFGPVAAVLTRPVDVQSVGPSNGAFVVRDEGGARVPGSYGFLFQPPAILFHPSAPLTPGSGFTAQLGTQLRDVQGNELRADRSCADLGIEGEGICWQFRTAAP